jgi:hypothetical protein
MPIKPIAVQETDGAFDVVYSTLSNRASAAAFRLPKLAKADRSTLAIAMPHRVEFLAFRDIRRETIPKKEKTDCWRFLVLEGATPIAAATAIRAESEKFEFGGLDEGPFVRGTQRAVSRAEDYLGGKGEFEAVLLLVPSRYVAALWLQAPASQAAAGHSSEDDLLLAISPSNPALDPDVPMAPVAFLDTLRRAR